MLAKKLNKIILALIIFTQFSALTPTIHAESSSTEKRKFLVTAYYSPLPDQSFYTMGSYEADMILNGRGVRGADGTPVYTGMLAAPKSYPFGTQVYIPGLGMGEVHDRGGAIVTKAGYDRIDVWMGHGEEGLSRALNWGSRLVDGEVTFNPTEPATGFDYSWVNSKISKAEFNHRIKKEEHVDQKETQKPSLPGLTSKVSKEDYRAEFVGSLDPILLKAGETQSLTLKFKNTGKNPWDKTTWLHVANNENVTQGRIIPLVKDKTFVAANLNEPAVAPGEMGSFTVNLEGGTEGGNLSFQVSPVINGKYKISHAQASILLSSTPDVVLGKTTTKQSVSQMRPSEKKYVEVEIENSGDVIWSSENTKTNVLGRGVEVSQSSTLSKDVGPGEKAKIGFWVEAPLEEGQYSAYMRFSYLLANNWVEIPGAVENFVINVSNRSDEPIGGNDEGLQLASLINAPSPLEDSTKIDRPFRVRLSHEAKNSTLTADSPYEVVNESNQTLFKLSTGEKIKISKIATGFEVKNKTITKKAEIVRLIPQERSGVTEIVSMKRPNPLNSSLNDNRFRGTIEIRIIDGEVAYINELPLEDYLRGLAEVKNIEPIEKQKVIAVLSRTYARYYMEEENRKFPGMPYDGTDEGDVFQRYLGYGTEIRSPNFVNAVSMTENEVVSYNGELIKAPYFNHSDGRTRSAEDVWGWKDTPYLTAVADPASKNMALKGHGVGLSGLGATKQAEQGKKFDEIIKYYYTGVDLQTLRFINN